MVTDCLNGATFNHVDNSISPMGHTICDVGRYWAQGTCTSDPSNAKSRVLGLGSDYPEYSKLYDQQKANIENKIIQYGEK